MPHPMTSDTVGRSLTYVEVDAEFYRLTQFEAAPDGVAVAGWSLAQGADTTLLGALNAAMPSGRAARIQKSVSGAAVVWQWTRVPNIAGVSVVALVRLATEATDAAVMLRHASPSTGYHLRLVSDTLVIQKGVTGASLATVAFPVAANENIWLRFDAANVSGPGVLLRGKAWRGALSDEPSTFTISFTDTTTPFTAAGGVGLWTFGNGSDFLCGHFRAKSLLGSLTETLRFAKSTDYLPREIVAVPDLIEASLSLGAISLGENLGERATLTAALKDHRGADLGELFDRGSHWGKARARGLFRRGQPVRVKRGLLGQALAQFETFHYVFDSFSGPSPQGAAALIAKDVLKLADDDRSLAPKPSNGFLLTGIDAVTTSATLSPTGIGNAEYPTSGYVAIGGKEICAFTRSGNALTLTRGQFGTLGAAHNAEDRVQLCLQFTGVDPALIINTLFTSYAGIASSYIPLTAWQTETTTFLQRVYTRLIAEPTGVNKLVSELIEQAGLAMWWDCHDNLIQLQVLRGIPVDVFLYTQRNILAGSLQISDQPEKQITQCWTYYGVRNPLQALDHTENYRSALATVDLEAETLNGSPVIRTILASWIPDLARATAQRVNDIQIGRFVKAPRKFVFDVMRYSGIEEPRQGGGYRIEWWGNQDEAGAIVNAPIQVTRINFMADRLKVEAEEMLFKQFVADETDNRSIIFDSNSNNRNVRTIYDSIYGTPSAQDILNGVNLTVTVSAGVIIGSSSVATRALEIGTFPTTTATGNTTNGSAIITNLSVDPTNMKVGTHVTGAGIQAKSKILSIDSSTQITLDKTATATASGVTLTFWFYILLVVPGRIQGRGGDGGPSTGPGVGGGVALYSRYHIDADLNPGGQVFGGGGGGGGGGEAGGGGGGGGGAGKEPGLGGSPGGSSGTTEAGGSGSLGGGTGGGPGLAGQNAGLPGGSPGAAIDGVSFVTVTQGPGDIRGPQIN